MKENGYKPVTEVIRKRFIGYKLGRISKKMIDNMTQERREMLDFIKTVDKNIQSTEKLLESLLPNVNRIMKAKQERKLAKAREGQSEQVLSEFWQEKRVQALERGDKDCPICY